MTHPSAQNLKSSSQQTRWRELQTTILATSRLLNLFGWDGAVAEEYCRPFVVGNCDPVLVEQIFREIYGRENRMPTASEILESAKRATPPGAKWLRASDGFCYAEISLPPDLRCGCRECRRTHREPAPAQLPPPDPENPASRYRWLHTVDYDENGIECRIDPATREKCYTAPGCAEGREFMRRLQKCAEQHSWKGGKTD